MMKHRDNCRQLHQMQDIVDTALACAAATTGATVEEILSSARPSPTAATEARIIVIYALTELGMSIANTARAMCRPYASANSLLKRYDSEYMGNNQFKLQCEAFKQLFDTKMAK